ncbi:hypothetical protein Lser_V15G21395 [Lactuca serriola]
MEFRAGCVVRYLIVSSFVASGYGVTFSSLHKTVVLSASSPKGHVLTAGEDELTITWAFNETFPAGIDSSYKTIKVKLCYAPVSQKNRPWRKIVDELNKDKTCQHKIVERPYTPSNNSFTWRIERDVPSASFFVRAYALDSQQVQVAYGQNTDATKVTDLFHVEAITGRHVSIDVASICFSAFSIVSLVGFFYMEKRKAKVVQDK